MNTVEIITNKSDENIFCACCNERHEELYYQPAEKIYTCFDCTFYVQAQPGETFAQFYEFEV